MARTTDVVAVAGAEEPEAVWRPKRSRRAWLASSPLDFEGLPGDLRQPQPTNTTQLRREGGMSRRLRCDATTNGMSATLSGASMR
jgi:hypothetical protein